MHGGHYKGDEFMNNIRSSIKLIKENGMGKRKEERNSKCH